VGVPRRGTWRELFNSDAKDFGGSGHGNLGAVETVPIPWNGQRQSINVTLPPLGAVFFGPTS
jgi:1,4-alpha-glucan branching enzyme